MGDLALIEAVKSGELATVTALIERGADVNQQDEQGWTPLNFAAGKGDLPLVQMLVKSGADFFKVGRDMRTPHMIALAAGRISVVKYLREVEDAYTGEKPTRPPRQYCKAYRLEDLRQYSGWRESRINWKGNNEDGSETETPFAGANIVFIHQDFTVTQSMWHNENVIFDAVDDAWKGFCANTLKFKVPDDLDLIVPDEAAADLRA